MASTLPTQSSHWVFFTPKSNTQSRLSLCKECKHFRHHESSFTSKTIERSEHDIGFCALFGHMNVVDAEERYFPATVARTEKALCGVDGLYFEKEMTSVKSEKFVDTF